jgi:hypothetical protein
MVREIHPLLCPPHGEALPAEFPKQAPHKKEPGTISIAPGGRLGDALAQPFDQATLRIPLFMRLCIDKVELSTCMIPALGISVIQRGEFRHLGVTLPRLRREDAATAGAHLTHVLRQAPPTSF